uniref:Urotensin 2 domain containing n=1 Tax=Myripristis murdjan TaxID=586833 RepID=A0A668AT47_9TELE
MDKVAAVNYCLGLLGLLLLQGVLSAEGRSILNPGNHVFIPKEDTDAQSKILALLLRKSLVPVERDDPLGETRRKHEDLELEREITANVLADGKSIPRKRGERK